MGVTNFLGMVERINQLTFRKKNKAHNKMQSKEKSEVNRIKEKNSFYGMASASYIF